MFPNLISISKVSPISVELASLYMSPCWMANILYHAITPLNLKFDSLSISLCEKCEVWLSPHASNIVMFSCHCTFTFVAFSTIFVVWKFCLLINLQKVNNYIWWLGLSFQNGLVLLRKVLRKKLVFKMLHIVDIINILLFDWHH